MEPQTAEPLIPILWQIIIFVVYTALNITILILVGINLKNSRKWGIAEKNALLGQIGELEKQIDLLKLTQVPEYNRMMEELQKAWNNTKAKVKDQEDLITKLRDLGRVKSQIIEKQEMIQKADRSKDEMIEYLRFLINDLKAENENLKTGFKDFAKNLTRVRESITETDKAVNRVSGSSKGSSTTSARLSSSQKKK